MKAGLLVSGGILAVGIASAGLAADQPISGKRLLIKTPPAGATANKVVHLSRDTSITVGAAGGMGDPQCSGAGGGGVSSLRIVASGGAGDVTIPLPCAGWTTNAANSLYRYRDGTGATCSVVVVANGVLTKAVCRGPHVAVDLNGSMSPVVVVTTLNTQGLCSEFGGEVVKDGSDGKVFLRKSSSPPATCPAPTTSSTSTTSTSTSSTLVCCELAVACTWLPSAAACTGVGGLPGAAGTVCHSAPPVCAPPPAASGPCCDFETSGPNGCAGGVGDPECSSGGASASTGVCAESGDCVP